MDVCDKCGAEMVVNPRTNKSFCAAKCWLNGNSNNQKPVQQNVPKQIAKAGATEGIGEVRHIFQHKYECGPAGNRHEIRYWNFEDLKRQLKGLSELGVLENNFNF